VCLGAAVLTGPAPERGDDALRAHAQALCDPLGLALQRQQAARETQRAKDAAQAQGVRNALLAAISHDYRTPLATILGAASSLDEQAERLSPAQRHTLARRIVDEVGQLSRLTDNTLQLARLDAPGVALRCDWESAEELVGAALRHAHQRDPGRRTRARVEPGLPLLWCDALLVSQLLDNLIDNALKHTPPDGAVELLVRRQPPGPLPGVVTGPRAAADAAEAAATAPLGWAVLAVRDRGPGVAPAWRERIFEVFQRGAEAMPGAPAALPTRGAGVGLAVCRAIARAHGGELRLRARGHGGSSFECWLPLREAPAPAPEATA
jgi:two-component system sensor histidine kinase KdpD